jgi:asparagine synthase (glutamine-hydrolysing)
MCGLACAMGSFGPQRIREIVGGMMRLQAHRGPDSAGEWYGQVGETNIGFGHQRLKILDLTDASRQPMVSADGRYVLIYNGEIYNYLELREELTGQGVVFTSRGDTEVLLQALIAWGTAAFARLNGMWALVLMDLGSGEVFLARDRFGIKPLYTYADQRGILVASEIKAILSAAGGKFRVNPDTANAFLTQALLCAGPETFYHGIRELPPGHWAVVSLNGPGPWEIKPQRFWSLSGSQTAVDGIATLIAKVRATFMDAVRVRLRSDVAVGILLSGGLDSSAIAGVVHGLDPSRQDIRIISAVGAAGERDEQPFIDRVARYLGRPVDKVMLDYPPEAAFDLISEATWFNDEPVGSFSTVAYYLLMQQARGLGVTVLLSGQGADESLCGYNKYTWFYLQELAGKGRWGEAARNFLQFWRNGVTVPEFSYGEAKRYLPGPWHLPELEVRGAGLRDLPWESVSLDGNGTVGRQLADIERLSVPGLVHYEDRMSMAFSREVRLPFLDFRLVNLLVPLPPQFKLHQGWTKWVFRRAMEPFLPPATVWRRDKQGFLVPQTEWLRHKLEKPIRRFLAEDWVTADLGLIERRQVQRRYDHYLRQGRVWGRLGEKDIFIPLALELWARRFEPYLTA